MNRRSLASSAPLASLLAAALLLACDETLECPVGETACGGRCAALETDAANCGACGFACSSGACQDGACACPPGKTECGGGCVDLATDPAHCGACATGCAPAQVCSASACAAACGGGLQACGRACVDLASDRWNCGACGAPCGAGESCDAGTCRTLAVACFATDEVRTVSPDLAWLGPVREAGAGPISLAVLGGTLFAANSISHSVSAYPSAPGPGTELTFDGSDFEHLGAHEGGLFVSNAGPGTLLLVDPATGGVLDEVALGADSTSNPRGIAFVGSRAYVALYGVNASSAGQEIDVVELRTTGCPTSLCGSVTKRISLLPWDDDPGLPMPYSAVAVGGKVYVTLANLKEGSFPGYHTDPAGNGKLAVIDTAADDALSIVDLGPGCLNPAGVAARGTTLWIACSDLASQALLPVDVSGDAPVAGPTVSTGPVSPAEIAFCAGFGYFTDKWSGTVVRFDPADPSSQTSLALCPLAQAGWAWAADVACAP
jgi:hypothetical protein